MQSRFLTEADRRMEAENYLSGGYATRLALEARQHGWVRLIDRAHVWQPSRLKGIQVSPVNGTPFLAATQVFDFRPIVRKWLALERTQDATNRFTEKGSILVTCSGFVGRATVTFTPHLHTLITHDLLRVNPRNSKHWGWIYAYLRAPKVRAMMTSSRYGHIIKHLEPAHLNSLPILDIGESQLEHFSIRVREIIELRDKAYACLLDAEAHFRDCLGPLKEKDSGEAGFVMHSSQSLFRRGKRLDASRHNPLANAIRIHLEKNGQRVQPVASCGLDIWVPGRYKRIPATDGVVFIDSSDLFEINPDTGKYFADGTFGDKYGGRVQPGWLLMASSGQTYGIIGGVVLATAFYEGKVVANHVIRIAPRKDTTVRVGYVVTAFSHPILGRPLLKSLAFGSSVPEISPEDIANLGLVRVSEHDEDRISDLAEESAILRAKADILETQLAQQAEDVLDRFINTDTKGLSLP